MKRFFTLTLAGSALLAMSSAGFATEHPHSVDPETETSAKAAWPFFGDKTKNETDSKIEQRFKEHAERLREKMESAGEQADRAARRHDNAFARLDSDSILKNPDDIRDAARALEDMIAESGIISNMADMLVDLAEDFEVENTDNGITLRFDGETLGRLSLDSEGHMTDSLDIEGMGKNLTMDKQVIRKDGKKKIRIVIEMDADDDVEVDVKSKSKSGF